MSRRRAPRPVDFKDDASTINQVDNVAMSGKVGVKEFPGEVNLANVVKAEKCASAGACSSASRKQLRSKGSSSLKSSSSLLVRGSVVV